MKKLNIRMTAALAAFGLAALSLAAADGYTIKHAYKAGDVVKYKQVGKFDVGGQTFDYEAVSKEKIVKVDPSGAYSIESTTSDVKLNGEDAPGGAGTPGPVTTSYSPKGEVLEIKGDNVEGNTYRFANLSLFIVPDATVKAGDSWSYDVKEDKKLGAVPAKATFTVVGDDKVGTTDAIKIKFSIKEAGTDAASSEGVLWIGKTDSTMLKLNAKWTNAPVPGAPVPISGEITISLVS